MAFSDALPAHATHTIERTHPFVPLALILCIALTVRAIDIGALSLWNDELFSRYYADLFGLKYLWTTGLTRENSPPLYYMLIAGWMHLFGTSEAAMRSLSMLASVLTVPLVYVIGRELFDRGCGMLAALVFALSPMQVHYAQEARTYALLSLPVGAVLWALARFMRNDQRRRILCAYAAGAVIAIYCHATAVLFLAACNLVMIAWLIGERSRAAWMRWLGINLIVGLLALPELTAIVLQDRTGAGLHWIAPFRPGAIVHMLSTLTMGHATPYSFPGAELALVLLACLGACFLMIRPQPRAVALLVAIPAIFVGLMAGASLVQPIFIDRVFLWLGVPLAVALGAALGTSSRMRSVLVVLTIAVGMVGLGYHFTAARKEPWEDLVRRVGPDLASADHVVVAPMTGPAGFVYYDPGLTNLEMWKAGSAGTVESDDMPRRLGVTLIARDQLLDEIRSGQHVWLVLRRPDLGYVEPLLAQVPPPRREIAFACHGVMCLTALAW